MLVVSSTSGNVGYIGTDGHHIQEIIVPKYRCTGLSSGVFNTAADMSGTNIALAGKSSHSIFSIGDDKWLNNGFSAVTFFSGAACTSGSPPNNPCFVKDISRSENDGGWGRLFYTANTASKFTYTTPSTDDGFANVPSAITGIVTQTNGGSSSILIGTNAKSGYTTKANQRLLTLMRTSYKVFFVDRKIGDLVP